MTDYDPTIEDSYTKQCIVDDVPAKLDSKYFSKKYLTLKVNYTSREMYFTIKPKIKFFQMPNV